MNQKSEETKEYKAPDMLKALKQAFMQKLENGDFLPYDSFLSNLTNLQRIIFDTEDLQERAKLYTYVMNNARAVDYAETTEKAFKTDASRLGIPELWELPQDFEKQVPMQKFNPDNLPDLLRDYVKAVAEYAQVDIEMCILPMLSVLSLCVQGKAVVKHPINSHTQPLCLYTLTIASPGEKKSGVLKEFKRPVEKFQKSYNNAHALDFAEYTSKIELLEKQRSVAIKKVMKLR